MREDILERLHVDPGQRTLGQILQDREAARHEIMRLRAELDRLRPPVRPSSNATSKQAPATTGTQIVERVFPAGALLRRSDVCKMLGLANATLYRKISDGKFPQPVQVGVRSVRWRLHDIEAWRDALVPRTQSKAAV